MSFALSFKEEKLRAIARRREELIDKAARQRRDLGDIHRQMERPLLWADWGWGVVRMLRDNPIFVSLGVAALMKFITRKRRPDDKNGSRPGFLRRAMRLPARLVEAWGVFKQVRGLFSIVRR